MTQNFQSKIVGSKTALVYLITAQAEGKPSWYYVQVDEPKHNAFKKQLQTGAVNLANYGKILESGWGAYPPEPIAALMEEKFAA